MIFPETIQAVRHVHGKIKAIADTSKTKEKEFILSELLHVNSAHGALAFEIMRRTYCGRVVYGVSHLPIPAKPADHVATLDLLDAFKTLDLITSRTITGMAARTALEDLMAAVDAETADLVAWMVNKDMRAGFGKTMINKVSKVHQIAEVPYMRCSLANNVGMADWVEWQNGEGVFVQLKADGMFQRAEVSGDRSLFVSRQGEIMPNAVLRSVPAALQYAAKALGYGDQTLQIDGEITLCDPYTGEVLPRKESNGLMNSARQNGRALSKDLRLVYNIWDVVVIDGTPMPYRERWQLVKVLSAKVVEYYDWLDAVVDHLDVCEAIESHIVYDLESAVELVQGWMLRGLEGGIAKKPGMMFKDGTSTDQVKMKIDFSFEAIITGYVEGKPGKKTAATFGAVKWESSCGLVRGQASGMSDKEREHVNSDRDAFVGTVVEITGNDLTQNRDEPGFWAVSHPRVTEFRTDKTEADDYEHIRAAFESAKQFKMPEGKKAKTKK